MRPSLTGLLALVAGAILTTVSAQSPAPSHSWLTPLREDAARLIKVEYEVLPHVTLVDQALNGSAPPVFAGGNTRAGQTAETGGRFHGSAPSRTRGSANA